MRLVVLTPDANQEQTLDLFRRGAHGIVSREVSRNYWMSAKWPRVNPGSITAASGGADAYRTQGTRPLPARSKVQLTPKESLIAPASLRE